MEDQSSDDSIHVSIVIPMHNSAATIDAQLGALCEQHFDGHWEVVIANNLSSDDSVERAQEWASQLPSLRIVDATEERGPAYARNVGSSVARGAVILYCDADDQVTDGWLKAMWDALQEATFVAAREDHYTLNRPYGNRGLIDPVSTSSKSSYLPWSRGGNIGVRASVWREVDGWDEARRIGEDVDFCWRIQRLGHALVLADGAVMRYRHPSGWSEAARRQFHFGFHAPRLYRDFQGSTGQPTLLGCVGELLWAAIRLPKAFLMGRRDLRAWCTDVAGRLGRLSGVIWLSIATSESSG